MRISRSSQQIKIITISLIRRLIVLSQLLQQALLQANFLIKQRLMSHQPILLSRRPNQTMIGFIQIILYQLHILG